MARAAAAKPLVYKFPKSMGGCADRLNELKTNRLAQQKVAEAIEAEEKALKEHIIKNLPKGDRGATGREYRVTVVTKVVPRVEDWDKFYKYVGKNARFDMLQRQLSPSSIQEMWENKKKIPGVEPFTVVSVSLNKV